MLPLTTKGSLSIEEVNENFFKIIREVALEVGGKKRKRKVAANHVQKL